MTMLFIEGFDKYGGPNTTIPSTIGAVALGGWSVQNGNASIQASLNGQPGYSLQLSGSAQPSSNNVVYASKTLNANYSRLIGGFRMSTDLVGTNGMCFNDGTADQCMICIMPTSGRIAIYMNRLVTQLQLGTASVAAGTEHYIEFDITFGNPGSWTVWLDGVQVLNGTGQTQTSGNNYCNVVELSLGTVTSSLDTTATYDDVYVFDSTTSFNNAVLRSNPLVLTQVPMADVSIQFANEGNAVGNTTGTNTTYYVNGNLLILMKITPSVNCTINSIVVQTNSSSAGGTSPIEGVLYGETSGAPHTLLSGGTPVAGYTPGNSFNLSLTSPTALTAGTNYYIGFITNVSNMYVQAGPASGNVLLSASNTYTSGPPNPAPSMGSSSTPPMMYALCSGASTNYESVNVVPPIGTGSAVFDATVGDTDLYQFPNLPTNISEVYGVTVSAFAQLNGSGSNKFDTVVKSSSTYGNGDATNIAPTGTFAWYDSNYNTDPHTTGTWTTGNVNIADYGMKVSA